MRQEFSLTPAQRDSLVLDVSRFSPEGHKEITGMAKRYESTFLSLYGKFVPESKIKRLYGRGTTPSERVIGVSHEVLDIWPEVWENSSYEPGQKGPDGVTSAAGMVSFTSFSRENLLPRLAEADQERLVEKRGSEVKAENYIRYLDLQSTLAHELVHQFLNSRIHPFVLERVARYYQYVLLRANQIPIIDHNKEIEKSYHLCKTVVDEYGDMFHRLMLGDRVREGARGKNMRMRYLELEGLTEPLSQFMDEDAASEADQP